MADLSAAPATGRSTSLAQSLTKKEARAILDTFGLIRQTRSQTTALTWKPAAPLLTITARSKLVARFRNRILKIAKSATPLRDKYDALIRLVQDHGIQCAHFVLFNALLPVAVDLDDGAFPC